MQKLLLVGVVIFGIVGCKESETGLQKNVINSAYKSCVGHLESLVKSPSSLRISRAIPVVEYPQDITIYKHFGSDLINTDTSKISQGNIDAKTRFRQLKINVDYEAQNSFGVFLGGAFVCKYIYSLHNQDESPQQIYLNSFETEDHISTLFSPLPVDNESNLKLNKNILKPVVDIPSGFGERDELFFKNAEFFYSESKKQ